MSSNSPASTNREKNHKAWIFGTWAVLSVIGILFVVLVLGPNMPPGNATAQAAGQQRLTTVLTAMVVPVVLLIWIYFVYAIFNFRQRGDRTEDGPADRGSGRLQAWWVGITTALVLFLAVYGSYSLVFTDHGAGAGQGPDPVSTIAGKALPVQVIGQQWQWTFRYPTFGGIESTTLMLPEHSTIVFHVTSLDVWHGFWAYQLGVKADAVPGTDNVDYVQTLGATPVTIRCSELCGLWHGQMYTSGRVVPMSQFLSWIRQEQSLEAGLIKYLPKYARVYLPEPVGRAG